MSKTTSKFPDKERFQFSPSILNAVSIMPVFNKIQKLKKLYDPNSKYIRDLELIQSSLAALLSMKKLANQFEEKANYDRQIASICRLMDQIADEKKYDQNHRMYALVEAHKRCNQFLLTYQDSLQQAETQEKRGLEIDLKDSELPKETIHSFRKLSQNISQFISRNFSSKLSLHRVNQKELSSYVIGEKSLSFKKGVSKLLRSALQEVSSYVARAKEIMLSGDANTQMVAALAQTGNSGINLAPDLSAAEIYICNMNDDKAMGRRKGGVTKNSKAVTKAKSKRSGKSRA